ncbi:jg21993, partial [Pararge aegeria aegeria]
ETPTKRGRPRDMSLAEPPPTMEIAQILISLLHAWGLDPDLDRVCESKLGLLRPMVPVCFGVVSRHGHMAVQLPTRLGGWADVCASAPDDPVLMTSDLPAELVRQEKLTRLFTSKLHWELSTTLTTNHLLSIVALANTLMSMSNASFVPEQEVARRLHRPTTRTSSWAGDEEREEQLAAQQAHIKQGWSLLATLHCVLLPDKVVAAG